MIFFHTPLYRIFIQVGTYNNIRRTANTLYGSCMSYTNLNETFTALIHVRQKTKIKHNLYIFFSIIHENRVLIMSIICNNNRNDSERLSPRPFNT